MKRYKKIIEPVKIKIKVGDLVKVRIGKDKGKTGKVEKVFPKKRKVLVTGVNVFKKHLKAKGKEQPGGIIDLTKPLEVSNLSLICPKCSKVTRIGYSVGKDNKKYRKCKKCQEIIK
ncbi:50S ribosomal protein L24 [Candidatus Beckwithbacteria bacterium CG10_big_fil_rev_8_21_14_0_10_34_10]|uniref:Large ribosomal subunit protein uL24 n=1 Tax=Candidatus Beckwithbacteria bacterium CG10_big_fil_rev_8_21_14_0_10_34_10 TaxID=1974495 RepID=A0A2H0W7W0_9BACT|nr:MAG: 50S ribosomal protein L24 [Candidatus Beckwithbacteria bacterium CG10_big_fil_rev_8_21_14_0_10_34_10]